jgi:hypothetical protein
MQCSQKLALQAFLYLLMRDDVVPGRVEELVQVVEELGSSADFSNTHLSAYAEELAKRLQ